MAIKRYVTYDDSKNVLREWSGGPWVRHRDVLDAIQVLIDQLASNPEWRNGAVLAFNAISCSPNDAATKQGEGP